MDFRKVINVYTVEEPTIYLCRLLLSDDKCQILFRFHNDLDLQKKFYEKYKEHFDKLINGISTSNNMSEVIDKLREFFDIEIKEGTLKNAVSSIIDFSKDSLSDRRIFFIKIYIRCL